MMKSGATNAVAPVLTTGTNDLRDIKPPVEIPSGWAWLLGIAGVLLLAALLYAAWRVWRKRQNQIPLAPPVPPHIRARRRLQVALALLGQPREFCIAVSDALRWYLEERFAFKAPERTTEEFLHELRATNLLTMEQKSALEEFLSRCDLVKFAKYEPAEPELRDLHSSATRLVDQTEPVVAAPGASQISTAASS